MLRQSVAGNSTFRGIVFCNLGTPKELFQISSPRGKLRPHIFLHMVTPTIFPVDKKALRREKSLPQKCINSFLAHKLSFLLFAKGFLAVVSQIVYSDLSPIAK